MKDERAWIYGALTEKDVEELEAREERRQMDNALSTYESVMEIMRRRLLDEEKP